MVDEKFGPCMQLRMCPTGKLEGSETNGAWPPKELKQVAC